MEAVFAAFMISMLRLYWRRSLRSQISLYDFRAGRGVAGVVWSGRLLIFDIGERGETTASGALALQTEKAARWATAPYQRPSSWRFTPTSVVGAESQDGGGQAPQLPFDSAQGRGRGAEKAICDPGTTRSLQKNMISENEPKFDQAGVEILFWESQKRTQIEAKIGG
jgi:hypothetical protein